MLLRKMLRDMKNNPGSFISIFIMAALASFVYSGINSEWYGMKKTAEKFYDETKLADIWLTADNFSQEDLFNVKKLNVVANAELRLAFDATVKINPSDNQTDKMLRINIIDENNTLSLPEVTDGSPLDSKADGLWLDRAFAEANKLKPGDYISFETSGKKFNMPVLGLILHPEYVYKALVSGTFMPSHNNYGFAFIYSSCPELNKVVTALPYNQILVAADDKTDLNTVRQELEDIFNDRYCVIIDRESHPSVSVFKSEIEQNKAMGGVFPIVFFLISALSMFTTMTRMTNNQRILIATLKALGFSKYRILYHYISYGIWIGLAGGLIGLLTGPLTIPPILFAMQKTIYTLPEWSIAISTSSILIVILLVLCCGAASFLACRGQLKEMPASSLRPEAPKHFRHNPLEKSKLWLRMNFSIQWNLRDIMRNRMRSVMVIIGVTGCTALLIFGFGLKDTVNNVTKVMYRDLNLYESKINLNVNPSDEALESISKSCSGQWIMEASIEISNGDDKENGSLTVLDSGDEIKFIDDKGIYISLPDSGVAMSGKIAQLLKVKTGDTIEWRIYGDKAWKSSVVTAIYNTPIGQGLSISRKEFEKLGESFVPTSFLTSGYIDNSSQHRAIKSIQHKEDLIDDFSNMLDSLKMIILILVLGSLILGSVVLYNLGVLSFTEKERELATLRVLGFFPNQIRSLLQYQNLWLTILGIIIGVPTGYKLVSFMMTTMPASLDMTASISLPSLLIGIIITFIISVSVNMLLSKDIKRINMVNALKSVE